MSSVQDVPARPAFAVAVCLFLSACAASGPEEAGVSSAIEPRTATYQCGEDGSLRIDRFGDSVVVEDGAELRVRLPASPPSQRSRYGEPPYALVLGDREALLMKTGEEPLSCRR